MRRNDDPHTRAIEIMSAHSTLPNASGREPTSVAKRGRRSFDMLARGCEERASLPTVRRGPVTGGQ